MKELKNLPVYVKGHGIYYDTIDSTLIHSFSDYSINSSDRYAELSCKNLFDYSCK